MEMPWIFAKTYAKIAPHEYIVKAVKYSISLSDHKGFHQKQEIPYLTLNQIRPIYLKVKFRTVSQGLASVPLAEEGRRRGGQRGERGGGTGVKSNNPNLTRVGNEGRAIYC